MADSVKTTTITLGASEVITISADSGLTKITIEGTSSGNVEVVGSGRIKSGVSQLGGDAIIVNEDTRALTISYENGRVLDGITITSNTGTANIICL
jgi:hypothetical protein